MTAERYIHVSQSKRPTNAFNGSISKGNEVIIRERAAKAVERLSARHQANEAALIAERFAKLWRADQHQPALKPPWATDNKRGWLYSAARYQVAHDFKKRIGRVNKVADRMIEAINGKSKERGRDTLGR
ncbi:MAG: hypothetical protein O9253_01505 [Aquidulcibacter sp.]|jgi:hypothetical protein|nr:hypothetical protein [Aquidulcibacter sp.]